MIKGMGRINRQIISLVVKQNKRSFEKSKCQIIESIQNKKNLPKLPIHIVSYSGEKFLNDQLYSIFSFFWNVGYPLKWSIFDDGTYTTKSIELLKSIPNLNFIKYNKQDMPLQYPFEENPTLKKIFLYKTVIIDTTTIFVDSDILFFDTFLDFIPVLQKLNWFLPDERYGYFDPSFVKSFPFDMYPCNSGVLIFNTVPPWQEIVDYIDEQLKSNGIMIWTEQTAFHKLTRGYEVMLPLDPRYFIVSGTDSFKISMDFDYANIALRHFVGPVRHKMWQINWKHFIRN